MLTPSQRYAVGLWLLIGLFAFRVCAQLVQCLFPVDWLPPFGAWQGSGLPYWALVSAQGLILVVMGNTAWRFSSGHISPQRRTGWWCLALGAIYFTTMAIRLTVGAAQLSSLRWFAAVLPALFHLVLASFVLVVGRFHWRQA